MRLTCNFYMHKSIYRTDGLNSIHNILTVSLKSYVSEIFALRRKYLRCKDNISAILALPSKYFKYKANVSEILVLQFKFFYYKANIFEIFLYIANIFSVHQSFFNIVKTMETFSMNTSNNSEIQVLHS